MQKSEITNQLPFRSTSDIIRSLENGTFPDQVMLTVHPQRWNDEWWPWLSELVRQRLKNPVKKLLIAWRK